MYRITNTSKGPRGIWSGRKLVWLQPGETRTFKPDNVDTVLRNGDFEAEPAGDLPAPPAELVNTVKRTATAKKPSPPATGRKPRRTKASK